MDKITAEAIKSLIAQRYDENKFATFFELRSRTGAGAAGAIDAFVMNVWPSSSFARYAFEIKISRNDFMHELDHPEKREWSMAISNEFWFVTTAGVCTAEEVPENCGLMVVSKNGKMLRRHKRATWREAEDMAPWEIASIIRSSARQQKFHSKLMWRYQGQDMNQDQLQELLEEKREWFEKQEINKKADEKAKEIFTTQNRQMAQHAELMREAGIEPPGFMMGDFKANLYSNNIKSWVDEHFVAGPDAAKIRSAISQMKMAENAMKAARDHLIKMGERHQNDKIQETLPST